MLSFNANRYSERYFKAYGLILFQVLFLMGCGSTQSVPDSPAAEFAQHGTVTESIHTEKYTYICIQSGNELYWLASNALQVEAGDELSYEGGLLMRDFYSPTLDRTFPAILFVNRAWVSSESATPIERARGLPSGHPLIPNDFLLPTRPGVPDTPELGSLPRLQDGQTLSELFSNSKKFAGTRVRVIGKVMKINHTIMGKNWIHLEDGTGDQGAYDLTVTSSESVAVGSVVVAEGIFSTNKSFNTGYYIPLLLEDAVFSTVGVGAELIDEGHLVTSGR